MLRENNIFIGLLSFEILFFADFLPYAFIDNIKQDALTRGLCTLKKIVTFVKMTSIFILWH